MNSRRKLPDPHHPLFPVARAYMNYFTPRVTGRHHLPVTGPALVIGTDCPSLTAEQLRIAANILRGGSDVVLFPAQDGGYGLIGMLKPQPMLFDGIIHSETSRDSSVSLNPMMAQEVSSYPSLRNSGCLMS